MKVLLFDFIIDMFPCSLVRIETTLQTINKINNNLEAISVYVSGLSNSKVLILRF